jgi:hypothetical protein
MTALGRFSVLASLVDGEKLAPGGARAVGLGRLLAAVVVVEMLR